MGMSTNSTDQTQLKEEFNSLKIFFTKLKIHQPQLNTLSMGMSGDYKIALKEGSNMIRVGSTIFGNRNYN